MVMVILFYSDFYTTMIYTQALEVNLSAGELGTNQMAHDKLFDRFYGF